MSKQSPSSTERRSFFTRLNAGAASLAAIALGGAAMQVKAATPARWEPTHHDKDDWLDMPSKHRFVFDTINSDGLAQSLAFAGNFIRVNKSDYGLESTELGVVLIVRHGATAFGYNDAMWAKYGATLTARTGLNDPKTKMPPTRNVFNTGDYGNLLQNRSTTFEGLAKLGVHFGVCAVATRALAGQIAEASGGKADDINAELIANLVDNARMVPAGIVAVNRAQERGYALASI